jgi:DNA helicase II / ATP-dependent DNA helicase PcrA
MNLNPQQKLAVETDNSHIWVVAGAGSGKTRVLTNRIIRLIGQGEEPQNIMAVTFTNKAANEMKKRLHDSIGHNSNEITVGTFHGICHRWLRKNHNYAGLPKDFILLDPDDQTKLLKKIIKELKLDEKLWQASVALNWISRNKDDGFRPHSIQPKTPEDVQWLVVYKKYHDLCIKDNLVDFGELLLRTYETLVNNHELLKKIRNKYSHVLVDEFQDTNIVQYELIKQWVGPHTWLFAVGDSDQSIYGWRGANINNINSMKVDFNPKIITLDRNYRSTKAILNAANSIIKNNINRDPKKLWTDEEKNNNPIVLYTVDSEVDEAKIIALTAKNWLQKGFEPNKFAILYRTHAQSRAIEEQLMQNNVPYTVYGGLRFFDRKEIKDVICYIRLTVNHDDNLAFERIINTPPRGLGASVEEQIVKLSKEKNISLWASAEELTKNDVLSDKQKTNLKSFINFIKKLDNQPDMIEVAKKIILDSGLRDWYQKEGKKQDDDRTGNLDEFVSVISRYVENNQNATLAGFIQDVMLEEPDSKKEKDSTKTIQMMTIHSAKGMEFQFVFLPGWESNLFPSRWAETPEQREEERRLAYVAITRAEKQAIITHCNRRTMFGVNSSSNPSKFIFELPRYEIKHQFSPMALKLKLKSPWDRKHG